MTFCTARPLSPSEASVPAALAQELAVEPGAPALRIVRRYMDRAGECFAFAPQERGFGDIMLASAWQGDNSGATVVRTSASATGMQFLQVPVARGPDGSPITGEVFGRIVNRAGKASQPLIVQSNPVPYKPVSLDTAKSKLVSRGGERTRG